MISIVVSLNIWGSKMQLARSLIRTFLDRFSLKVSMLSRLSCIAFIKSYLDKLVTRLQVSVSLCRVYG
jgi:hypothetical protein